MEIPIIISLLYFITIGFIITLVIINNGEPIKTISWILVLLLVPIFGMVLYFFLGNNLRRNKILNKKELIDRISEKGIDTKTCLIKSNVTKSFESSNYFNTIKLLAGNSGAALTKNNTVNLLIDGEQIYSEIKKEISKATNHIHMDFYRIQPGKVWNEILEILKTKLKQGVSIKIIYDDVGSWGLKSSYATKLRKEGFDIEPFMPVFLPGFANKLNYRNHRKIIVIDGKCAFTGGFNIADKYLYGTEKLGKWHDVAVKIIGEAVHSIQRAFLMDWAFVKREIYNYSKDLFPDVSLNANSLVQIVKSGPDSDWSSIMQSYFSAINSSKKYVYLSTPYFLPNESILTALKTVALSGRTVKLVIPHKADQKIVNYATHSYINELLEAGIEVFLFNKGFNHGKFIIVDGEICSIGTANIDIRSFDHDFEINAFIYDTNITKQLEETFLYYTKNSIELNIEKWKNRPAKDKFMSSFSRIWSPMF